MKKQTGHYIYKLGNWKLALLLLLLFVSIGWAQETYPIGLSYLPKISPAATALDTSSYTAAEVYPRLSAMGQEARMYYKQVLMTTDMFFPILYRLMLIVLGIQAVKLTAIREGHLLYLLAFVPLSSMLADIAENSLITAMINRLPEQHEILAVITSFLTEWKWISNYVEWFILGGLLLTGIIAAVLRKTHNSKEGVPHA